MSQVLRSKAAKPRPAYKARRQAKALVIQVRQIVSFNRDIDVAYAELITRANAHNLARGVYADRPPPGLH